MKCVSYDDDDDDDDDVDDDDDEEEEGWQMLKMTVYKHI